MKKIVCMSLAAGLLFLCACAEPRAAISAETAEPVFSTDTPVPTERTERISEADGVSGIRLSPLSSRQELTAALAEREERTGESVFEVRGSAVADLTACAGEIAYMVTDYAVEPVRMGEDGTERLPALNTGHIWQETDSGESWSGCEKRCEALLVSGDSLIVLSNLYAYAVGAGDHWENRDTTRCTVDIYDIREPSSPRWLGCCAQTGTLGGCLLADGKLRIKVANLLPAVVLAVVWSLLPWA